MPNAHSVDGLNCAMRGWQGLLRRRPGQNVSHSFQREGNVLAGVGVGESEMSFAVFPETRAGEAGYAGFFEERVRQGLGRISGVGDAWEGVERAFRGGALDAGEGVESGQDLVSADPELGEHAFDAILRACDGGEPGLLGDGAGAGVGVGL